MMVEMQISCHGVKKSNGSTIVFAVGLIFAFSLVMVGLVSWINSRYEKVRKEYQSFYANEYIVPPSEDSLETF